MASLADIPFYGAYKQVEAANRAAGSQDLQQMGALQGILAQIEAQKQAPMKAELLKAQVAKAQQEAAMTQQLMAGGGMEKMTPEQLDMLGQKLAIGGHPGAATVMNIADKRRAAARATQDEQGTLSSLQGAQVDTPVMRANVPETGNAAKDQAAAIAALRPLSQGGGSVAVGTDTPPLGPPVVSARTGGAFSPLFDSQIPAIASSARDFQARVDAGKITGKDAEKRLETLMKAQTMYETQAAGRSAAQGNKIEIRNMFPPAGDVAGQKDMVELTPEGNAVKNDLIRNGLPVPKTRRGLVDNEALNSIGKETAETGAVPVSANRANYRATSAAMAQNSKDLTAIRPYNDMLHMNGDIAIKLAEKAIATDSKLLNKPINWLKQNAGDNPDVAEFLAQAQIVSTESARVLNNPRLVGQLTDSARHEMQGIVNGDMPLESFTRVIKRMQADGNNRVSAMVRERNYLNRQLGGNASPAPDAAAPAAAPRVRKWNPETQALE